MNKMVIDSTYKKWLSELKLKVQQAQIRAAMNINQVLIEAYWDLGQEMVVRQQEFKWGDGFIDQLAIDLKHEFPQMTGFSRRNLYAIRQWYLFFSQQFPIVPQPVAQLPWTHQRLIVSKIKDVQVAILMAQAAIQNSWSRDTLEANIKSNYPERIGRADHNFTTTLPRPQSD